MKVATNWLVVGGGAAAGAALVGIGAGKFTPWMLLGAAIGGGAAWYVFGSGGEALWAELERQVAAEDEQDQTTVGAAQQDIEDEDPEEQES